MAKEKQIELEVAENSGDPTRKAVCGLIEKLCADAISNNMRDAFQHYDAIAKLYTAIK